MKNKKKYYLPLSLIILSLRYNIDYVRVKKLIFNLNFNISFNL